MSQDLAPLSVHRSVSELWVEDARECRDMAAKLDKAIGDFLDTVEHAKDLSSVAATAKVAAQLRKQAADSLETAKKRHEAEHLGGKKDGLNIGSPQTQALLKQRDKAAKELRRLERLAEQSADDDVIDVPAEVK